MISPEDKERVRQATDIVALVSETVALKQRGQEFWGCCPFHGEKTPSFHVIPATGLFKCFGCGVGGDVFAFVMKRDNLEFPDAIRYLADKAGIEIQEEHTSKTRGPKRNRIIEALSEAEQFYSMQLLRGKSVGAQKARSYLSGRSFGSAISRKWKLGYAPGHNSLCSHLQKCGFTQAEIEAANLATQRSGRLQDRFYDRVIFPIHDERGNTIAFGGRIMGDGQPKYLNSSETQVFHKSKSLFALDVAKEAITARAEVLVVEGYTDVIALHEAGFTQAVATLGTALTQDHIKLLSRFNVKRIIFMFDGDAAGQRAAERSVQFIDKCDAQLLCVVLPNNQDPAEYLEAHTNQDLTDELSHAVPLMDFVFEKRMSGYALDSPGMRVRALDEMAQVLAPLKNSVLLDEYAMRLADLLGLNVANVRKAIREKPIIVDDAKYSSASFIHNASEDYVQEQASAPIIAVSAQERSWAEAECELLAAIAMYPDTMKLYADRIASLTWTDARYEAMVWAMLATPQGTDPSGVVSAAIAVVPDAPAILASARLATSGENDHDVRAEFIVDTAEFLSLKRQIAAIRSQLKHGQTQDDEGKLFSEATELQKRLSTLQAKLSSSHKI